MSLAEQITAMAWTLAIGMLAGFCYEFYRALRDVLGLKKIGTFAGDIIFWLFLTAFTFTLLVRANYGQLRLYVFIGLLLGALLFVRLLGDPAYRLVRGVLTLGGRGLRILARIMHYAWLAVTFPLRIIFMAVAFPLHLAGRLIGLGGRFAGRLARRPVGWVRSGVRRWAEGVLRKLTPRE